MKKLIYILSIIISTISYAQQQDAEIWQTYRIKSLKGKTQEFEKAVSKKTRMFNKSPQDAIFTFKVVDGQDQGMYERVVGFKNWSWFNRSNQKEMDYWMKNVDPLIESQTGWIVWERIKEYSHNWNPGNAPSKHQLRRSRMVKPSGYSDFLIVHERMKKVYDKYGYKGIKGLFRCVSGGSEQMFLIVSPFNEYGENAGFEKSDKNTAELYNEMFGDNAWQKDILKYNSSLVDWGRSAERLTIVKSMSSQN